jgi:RecB family endonuclease NucS
MVIYSFEKNLFTKVQTTTFNSEGILERHHLQSAIKNQIDTISPGSLVISEEFSEWSESQRRIDLLGIDKEVNLVVIELKRNETGEHRVLIPRREADYQPD